MIKGGEFLIKDQEAKDIFIPEEFGEDQLMMASATKEFVEKELDPHREQFEKKDYQLTEDCMKKAGELGLLSVNIPEEYGGLGMNLNMSMLICGEISSFSGSVATAYGAHTGIGTYPILLYGSEELKKMFLPKIGSGEWMSCYNLTEPNAGSDANSGKTTATLSSAQKVDSARHTLNYEQAKKDQQEIQLRIDKIDAMMTAEQNRIASRTGETTSDPGTLTTLSSRYTSLKDQKDKLTVDLSTTEKKSVTAELGSDLIGSAEKSFS